MPRHPFDPISAVLGILAVTTGLFVLLGAPVDVDNHGGGWIAVLIGLIGLAIIPWHRPRRDPGSVDEPPRDDGVRSGATDVDV